MKGFVKKRKDGRWEGIVRLPGINGNRRQKHIFTDTKQECQRLVDEELIAAYELKRKDGEED